MDDRSTKHAAVAERSDLEPDPALVSAWRGKSVLVAGLGNIGSALAPALARLGIHVLRLIDRDYVEPRNAHNQAYDRQADAGRPKVEAVAARIRAIDVQLVIEPIVIDLDAAPLGLFDDMDLCFGCLDSLRARQILVSERAWPLGVPVIDGGVDGGGDLVGRVQMIVPGGACLECGWGSAHYRQLGHETPCQPQKQVQSPPTRAPAHLGEAVAQRMLNEASRLLSYAGPVAGREIVFDLAGGRTCVSRTRPATGCRFDHTVVRERIPLGRSFERATLGDLLRAAERALGPHDVIQFEFPRGLLGITLFGRSRWISSGQLVAHRARLLADLQLSARDRIRVRLPGRDAFLVLDDMADSGWRRE